MCGGEAAILFLFVLLYYSISFVRRQLYIHMYVGWIRCALAARSVCLSRVSLKTNMHTAAIGQESFKWLCTLSYTHTYTSYTYNAYKNTRYYLRNVFFRSLRAQLPFFDAYWVNSFVFVCFYIETFQWSSLCIYIFNGDGGGGGGVPYPRSIGIGPFCAFWFKDSVCKFHWFFFSYYFPKITIIEFQDFQSFLNRSI